MDSLRVADERVSTTERAQASPGTGAWGWQALQQGLFAPRDADVDESAGPGPAHHGGGGMGPGNWHPSTGEDRIRVRLWRRRWACAWYLPLAGPLPAPLANRFQRGRAMARGKRALGRSGAAATLLLAWPGGFAGERPAASGLEVEPALYLVLAGMARIVAAATLRMRCTASRMIAGYW